MFESVFETWKLEVTYQVPVKTSYARPFFIFFPEAASGIVMALESSGLRLLIFQLPCFPYLH